MKKLIVRLLVLALIVVAAWFALRWYAGTDWARQGLERRLARKLDLEVTIGSTSLEWPLTLVAKDLVGSLPGSSPDEAELTVRELRLTPCARNRLWRGARLVLVKGDSGDWQPGLLMGFAQAVEPQKSVDEVLNAVSRATRGCLVNLENAAIFVRDKDGAEQPLIGGLNWHTRRVFMRGYRGAALHTASLQTRNGQPVGVNGSQQVEWLGLRGHAPILLADFRESESAAVAPAVVPQAVAPVAAVDEPAPEAAAATEDADEKPDEADKADAGDTDAGDTATADPVADDEETAAAPADSAPAAKEVL